MPETASPATTTEAAPVAPAAAPAVAAPAKDPWADFKPPEGFTPESLKDTIEFARKNGLDPKAAAAIALRDKARSDKEDADFKQLSEKGWLEELTADPKLGGDKVRETMVTVMRAHDRLAPEIQTMIKDSGSLYNPLLVRVLHNIGSNLREDSFVRPGTTPAPEQKKSQDERLQSLWQPKPNK